MAYYARPAPPGGEQPQLLKDHLRCVAKKAAFFAAAAGLDPELGRWAGLLHDLGKYSDEFQQHRLCLNPDGSPNGAQKHEVMHACHGAAIAQLKQNATVAFAVLAHHSQLSTELAVRDNPGAIEGGTIASKGLRVGSRAATFAKRARDDGAFQGLPGAHPAPGEHDEASRRDFELETRMLYSCLIDADRLDAEGWADPKRTAARQSVAQLHPAERLDSVLRYIEGRARTSSGAPQVNALRRAVLAHALEQAERPGGFFSLTVPTGGGKTLTSLAFALAHAAAHDLRRVIFVIPYLSIIEQNVDVIREALAAGDDFVLEHHSNVVDEEEGDEAKGHDGQEFVAVRRRLLAENWDAPVVVTTTVQFFDALFSNRPKKARRLHNIARSVVVFDEAQTFPPGMLQPMMTMLQQLAAEPYRTSFVFCTATQPALTVEVGPNRARTGPLLAATMRELAPDPPQLFEALKRVEVRWPETQEPQSAATLAASMMDTPRGQALAVMNTKGQARELFSALHALDPTSAFHLSTRMCAAHRLQVLDRIRQRAGAGQPCRVASTQLIEAGVDLDMPAVWRAIGPFDSIAQAAGRCNREGTMAQPGIVTVFWPWDDVVPGGGYRDGRDITETLLDVGAPDIHDPASFEDYFRCLYYRSDLDAGRVDDARTALNFPEVDERFCIIDDNTTAVLVPYGEAGRRLVQLVERLGDDEDLWASHRREMQRYSVALYRSEFERAMRECVIVAKPSLKLWYVPDAADYDESLGLRLAGDFSQH